MSQTLNLNPIAAEGYVYNMVSGGPTWAQCCAQSPGTGVNTTSTSTATTAYLNGNIYIMDRSWLPFSLAGAVRQITAATLTLYQGANSADTGAQCLFQGTAANPPTVNDIAAFTGAELAARATPGGTQFAPLTFTLNAAGIAYLNAVGTGNACFCLRSAHDVDLVAPTLTASLAWYDIRYSNQAYWPVLTITLEDPTLAVPSPWDVQATQSHLAIVSGELHFGETDLGELPISGGSVSIDATRATLRTCSVEVSPLSTWPLSQTAALIARYGTEVKLYRGIRTMTGANATVASDTLIPLGVFLITDFDYNERGTSLTLNGSDRSVRISRARFVDPYTITAGTDLAAALSALLTDRWPACPIGFSASDTSGATVAAAMTIDAGEGSDPWASAQALAVTAGLTLYFDTGGVARLRVVPDLLRAQADYTYAGGEAGVVIDSSVHVTYDKTYTGVVVTGQGSGAATPVRSVAWDTNPLSPTYYLGPAGMVPYFYDSPLITTQAQADTCAATLLATVQGFSRQVAWTQVVNPKHDAWDVVDLTYPDGSIHRYLLDQITMPLDVGSAMSATARETQVINFGGRA